MPGAIEDTHVHRATILDWDQAKSEEFIGRLQELRLLKRKQIEEGEAKAKLIRNERERDRAMTAHGKMVKLMAKVEKDLAKINDHYNYIRMLCVQEGINIYENTEAKDVGT